MWQNMLMTDVQLLYCNNSIMEVLSMYSDLIRYTFFFKFQRVSVLRIDTSGLRPYQKKGDISWSK